MKNMIRKEVAPDLQIVSCRSHLTQTRILRPLPKGRGDITNKNKNGGFDGVSGNNNATVVEAVVLILVEY